MLSSNKSYKNRKVSLTIHCKYKYFDSAVQRAEERRQKFYFCRLPFAVNVKLNLSIHCFDVVSTTSEFIAKFLVLFFNLSLFFLRHIKKYLSGVYC